MKKLFLLISLVIIVLIIINNISPNPVGVYIAKNHVNTIDTVFVNKDGTYSRVICQMKNNKVLFKNSGKWEYKNGRMLFKDFFPNDDAELFEGYAFDSVLLTFSVPLEKSYLRVVFDYDETNGSYRFFKLWW